MAAGLRCGSTTIKYLLFFFNFLFVLCGLVILVVGGLAANQLRIAGTALSGAVIFVLVLGACIFVISFFGCCGAVRESHCMLVTFSCLLMTIIVCEVIAAVLLFIAINGNGSDIDKTFQDLFDEAKKNNQASLETVNAFQQTFRCCGIKDSSFWGSTVPGSCCDNNEDNCKKPFSKGCLPVFKDIYQKFGLALGVIAICVAFIEVLGVWFALALAGEIKKISR